MGNLIIIAITVGGGLWLFLYLNGPARHFQKIRRELNTTFSDGGSETGMLEHIGHTPKLSSEQVERLSSTFNALFERHDISFKAGEHIEMSSIVALMEEAMSFDNVYKMQSLPSSVQTAIGDEIRRIATMTGADLPKEYLEFLR